MKSTLLHLGISFMVCILAVAGYIYLYQMISYKSVALVEVENNIQAKLRAEDRASSARSSLVKLEDDEQLVRSYFIPESNVVPFIDELETLGRVQGVGMEVLSVSTKTVDAHPAFVLNLALHGTFDAVMRTVGIIEYAPYATTISVASLSRGDKNNWQANLEMIIGAAPVLATATSTQASNKSN